MRTLFIGLMLLLLAASVEAGTLNYTTTTEQDAALVTLRKQFNLERKTPLTMAEYKDYLITQWLDGLVSKANEDNKTTIREAYQSAPQATKDQVKTLLGVQ